MMAFKEDHNLFVGGKYGSFKGLQCSLDKILAKSLQNVKYITKDCHITVMKWGDEEERELLLATANQFIKVYDTEYKSYVQNIPVKYGQGSICGVSRFNGILVTAVESGQIRIWTPSNDAEEIVDPEDLDFELSATTEINFGAEIITGKNLSCMQHSQFNKNIIGSGGQGNDIKLWDLTTEKNIFHAKNLPDDAVSLTEPIWVSDIAFLPEKNAVAVCSRYGYVRVYDPKTQRKPVWVLNIPEQALTCMALSNDHSVICGLAKGDMLMVDIRMKKLVNKYKGFLGAVRGIACHPTAPYIASVSLDRHVRIHHRDTKELLIKEYLKLPLNCIAMRSESIFTDNEKPACKPQKRNAKDDAELEEYNDMLNSLEKVEENAPKKVKKESKTKQRLFINPFASAGAAALAAPRAAPVRASENNGLSSEETDGDSDGGLDNSHNSDECQPEDEEEDSDCMILE